MCHSGNEQAKQKIKVTKGGELTSQKTQRKRKQKEAEYFETYMKQEEMKEKVSKEDFGKERKY